MVELSKTGSAVSPTASHTDAKHSDGPNEKTANKGAANGYAPLDSGVYVPDAYIHPTIARDSALHHKGYDAYVDAAGNGDYTDIQAALDAGHTGIFVVKGTYTITSGLVIPAGVRIVGANAKDTIISWGNNSALVRFNGSDCSIENITFDGNGQNPASGLTTNDASLKNLTLKSCIFTGFGTAGPELRMGTGNENWDVSGCQFLSTGVSTHVIVKGVANSRITNCLFDQGTPTAWIGLMIHCPTASIDNCIFSNNVMRRGGVGGPYVSLWGSRIVLSGNVGSEADGFVAVFGVEHAITDNLIEATGNASRTLAGVDLQEDNCVVANNNFNGFKTANIDLGSFAQHNRILGNYLVGSPADGIKCAGDDNIIYGNRCRTNTGWGISITGAGAVDNIVAFNNVKNNTAGGFEDLGTDTRISFNVEA